MKTRKSICISSGIMNEESSLPDFFHNNAWVDEVIMCDAGCTDGSVTICQEFGAKIYRMKQEGMSHNKRAAFVLSMIESDWILLTDPDEVVSDFLKQEILDILGSDTEYAAFEFPRVNFFMDKPLRHGGWSGNGLRFFRRDKVRFEGDSYHEHPIIDGTIGQLKGEVLHYPNPNIHWIVQKFNYISEFDSKDYFNQYGELSEKKFKWLIWTKPFKNFFKAYIRKQGYRDGLHGLIYAMLIWAFDVIRICKYAERYLVKNPNVLPREELPDPWECRRPKK